MRKNWKAKLSAVPHSPPAKACSPSTVMQYPCCRLVSTLRRTRTSPSRAVLTVIVPSLASAITEGSLDSLGWILTTFVHNLCVGNTAATLNLFLRKVFFQRIQRFAILIYSSRGLPLWFCRGRAKLCAVEEQRNAIVSLSHLRFHISTENSEARLEHTTACPWQADRKSQRKRLQTARSILSVSFPRFSQAHRAEIPQVSACSRQSSPHEAKLFKKDLISRTSVLSSFAPAKKE